MTAFAQIGGPAGIYLPAELATSLEAHPLRDAELLALSPEQIATLDDETVVELLGAVRRRKARVEAQEFRALARLHTLRDGDRYVADEAGLELRISRHAADGLVDDALGLVDRMPTVMRLLDHGELDAYTARRLAQTCAALSDAHARQVDELLGVKHTAGKLNLYDPVKLRRATQRLVLRVDPAAARTKAAKARRERKVQLFPGEDTMSTLYADLPAEVAASCYARLDRDARRLRNSGDERTLDQLRADVLASLLTGGEGAKGGAGGGAVVFLHMPIDTALTMSDTGCELSGYGPIPGPIARDIMTHPDSVLRKILVDPTSGEIKGLGRTRRRTNQALRDLIAVRDRECAYCSRPAASCDADHLTDWQHLGPTDPENLGAKCEHHHYLKDHPDWDLDFNASGDGAIITPTKRAYPRRREPIIEPRDPEPEPPPPPEREPQIELPPF